MAFTKGDPRINRQGRPEGTKNKAPDKIRTAMAMLLEDNLDNMSLWLAQIAADNPEKAMDIMIRLSERFVPKLSATQITGADGEELFKSLTFNFGPALEAGPKVEDIDYDELDITNMNETNGKH